MKRGAKYCENSKEKAQGTEVLKTENAWGKEGRKGDFNEEVHVSESWWEDKGLKRKEEGSRELGSRSLKYSRQEFPISRKDVVRMRYESRLWGQKELGSRLVLHICAMEYYLSITRYEILPFSTTWMDIMDIMLSKISQTEKDKYHMISLICENFLTWTNQIKQKQTYRYRDQSSVYQRGRAWGKTKWVKGVSSMVTDGN